MPTIAEIIIKFPHAKTLFKCDKCPATFEGDEVLVEKDNGNFHAPLCPPLLLKGDDGNLYSCYCPKCKEFHYSGFSKV